MERERARSRNPALYCIVLGMLPIIIFLSSALRTEAAPGCPENITNYWMFDETGGVTFTDFVGSKSAACTGASCPASVPGRINNALLFDGVDDGIEAPFDVSFDWTGTDSFTIELWMKTDSASTCAGGQVIAGRTDSSTQLRWWVGCQEGGQATFYLYGKDGPGIGIAGSTALTDGHWHHIVAVRHGAAGDNSIYVDGLKENSASILYTDGFDSATAGLNIGWLALDTGHYYFAGMIDEVALYNAPLSGEEIGQHYANGLSGIGYCDFAAPFIASTAVTETSVGQVYSYTVTATGNPAPTFSLTTSPTDMTINSTTGLIQWTPSAAGAFDITVQAGNGVGTPATQSFTIQVSPAPAAPAITSAPVTETSVGQVYSYTVTATGNPAPTFSLATSPTDMTINSTTGLIQWTPSAAGAFDITVQAGNGVGTPATQTFILSVSGALVPDWTSIVQSPFNLVTPVGITNPVLTARDVTDIPAQFVADPFLFHENDTWYLFFEVYSDYYGHIGLAKSSDGMHWQYDQIVLDEGRHHSYPLVFKYTDHYYMLPESYLFSEVRLYEASNFPYGWSYVSTLASGRAFTDPSIFRYNNTWWMFVSDTSSARNCYLYYSDDLLSGWVEHPKSPVVTGYASKTRPGGRSFVFDSGRIIRIAQKDDVAYGEAVRAFEVDILTKTDYAEHEISESPILIGSGSGWNAGGMHQFDPWWTGSQWICAVDGWNTGDDWSIGIYTAGAYGYYAVTPSTGANGVIDPGTPQAVSYNATTSFTVTPNTGYHVASVTGCGGTLSGDTYTTGSITANCRVKATFAVNTYTVTPSAGANGGINPSNSQTVNYNATTSFTVTPNTGYHIASVTGCGGTLSGGTYTTGAITGNCTVTATFAINTYTVTPSVTGGNGTISCTPTSVAYRESFTCSLSPAAGYYLQGLTDNASNVTSQVSGNSYIVSEVTRDHDIDATFGQLSIKKISGETSTYYLTIQAAYDPLSIMNGDIIQSQALSFDGNLDFNLDKEVTLRGGYDSAFSSQIGDTTVRGMMTISKGTVILDRLILN